MQGLTVYAPSISITYPISKGERLVFKTFVLIKNNIKNVFN